MKKFGVRCEGAIAMWMVDVINCSLNVFCIGYRLFV